MQFIKINKTVLLTISLLVLLMQAHAQKRKHLSRTAAKKNATKKTVQNKSAVKNAVNTIPLFNHNYDSIPIPVPQKSKEADYVTLTNPLANTPGILDYEPISEDDVMYRQRVWRDIDIREKMNQPFTYNAEEDNGSQQFIYVLLNAIKNDPSVVAYNPLDDRFTQPLSKKELSRILVDEPYVDRVPDRKNDSDGSKGLFIDTVLVNDFNPAKVGKYRLKEEWIFNKKTSRMVVRILGIAPIEEDSAAIPGERLDKPLFWLYYPKLRPSLANAKVYNSKNHGSRQTWESVFESRMFSSSIVKSTMDNPGDVYVKYMPGLKDKPVLQLHEGEKIKNAIQDYEQNLWSY
jgi:gliding motility associated protien GldN